MGYEEVAPMPYFHSPFIDIAQDEAGKQLAVIFYEDGKIKQVELVRSYAEIIEIFEDTTGYKNDSRLIKIFICLKLKRTYIGIANMGIKIYTWILPEWWLIRFNLFVICLVFM